MVRVSASIGLGFKTKELPKINNGDNGAAKIRNPLDIVGDLGRSRDLAEDYDLLDLLNPKRIRLVLDSERDKLSDVPF